MRSAAIGNGAGQGRGSAAPFDPALLGALGVELKALATDSRKIGPGAVFLAYPGERADGRKFISQAIAAGAAAVIWEKEGFDWDRAKWNIPNLGLSGLRGLAGAIAGQVYGDPSGKLWTIGVTGTNGKTSCAHWLAGCLTELGRKTAVVGTLGNGFEGELSVAVNTTPDPVELQRMLAEYLAQGAQCVAMEVSSHGLAQGRVNGMAFDVAVLTNLSRDHLDYHGDMESYARAKAGLFAWPGLKHAVLNLGDPFGAELARTLGHSAVAVLGYGLGKGEVCGRNLRLSEAGLELEVHTPWGETAIRSRLLGAFNAANLLAVLAALLASGAGLAEAARLVSAVTPVAGRMQRLGKAGQPCVIVDYAHTPDALEKVLQALRQVMADGGGKDARLICVFGCGGERDKGKRPLMGEVCSRYADSVIVTSDNPRGEDPRAIIDDIVQGLQENYHVIEDRATAIFQAVSQARPGDVVLIAGKGHEPYQEICGVRLPFSDVEVARRALENIGD